MKKIILFECLLLMLMIGSLGMSKVYAHCDTLEGPVIKEAMAALESGDITPALKWIAKEHEAEVRTSFDKALKERAQGLEAKEKADMEFFETLVRIHREGEGALFEGIKPAGTALEPEIIAADYAIETGSVDSLVEEISKSVASGIRQRFNRVIETKKHMDESVEAGREYVAAYVEFMHYVEGVHKTASGIPGHHFEAEAGQEEHKH